MKLDFDGKAFRLGISVLVSMVALCAALYSFAATGESSQFIRVYLCVVGALVLQMVLYQLLARLPVSQNRELPFGSLLPNLAGAVFFIAGMAVMVQVFPSEGFWEQMPRWLMVIGLFLFVMVLWPYLSSRQEGRQGWLSFAAVCIFAVFSYAAICYVPNLLNGSGHQIHHVTAVTQSIYNAAFNTPYTVRTSGMYGHYAIFFWPFLHLFGHKPQTVALMLAFCGALTQLLLAMILLRTVRSRPVATLALLATACFSSQKETAYLQVFPLRHLWPAAILLFTVSCVQKGRFGLRRLTAGYLLCCLAIVWNTDSGLISLVAFTVFVWLWHWRREKPWKPALFKMYLQTVLGMSAAVVGMMAIVNLYNLLCGGQMILRACFFPILGGNGYTQRLSSSLLEAGTIDWLIPIVVFCVSIAVGLTATSWQPAGTDETSEKRLFLVMFGVMGIGQSYYYFNRAAAGTSCVEIYMILCLALMAALALPLMEKPRQIRKVWQGVSCWSGLTAVTALSGLALVALTGAAPALATRLEDGTYSSQSLLDVAAEVQAKVPANTYAFGDFTQEIYAQLGWDPGYHQRDVSDFKYSSRAAREANDQTSLEILEEVNSQDSLLVHPWQISAIIDNTDLVPVFGIPESEPVVYYCTRDGQIPAAFSTEDLGKNSLPIYQTKSTGITRRDDHYEFETVAKADLLLAADPIHENGFVLRVDTEKELFSNNGQQQFSIEILLDGTSVGSLTVQAADDPQHLELKIPASQMPDIPENGLYRVDLVCHTQPEVSEDTVLYYLTYAGAPAE